MTHRAALRWNGIGYAFDATTGGGISLQVGVDDQDRPVGPRAKELVCLGLGACSGSNLVTLMKKMRQPVERIDIEVEAEQADQDPMVFTHVRMHYRLYGRGIDPAKVEKALRYIDEKYCGVLHMVNKTARTEYSFEIVEV
ncbi:MAG TPA: OsmC family protein [Symbiobacteriaceae bacterium]